MQPPPADSADPDVVRHFGLEWTKFDQTAADADDLAAQFDAYFALFPWDAVPPDAAGIDIGCGSGRWARFVAPRVGTLHCLDPSPAALDVARRNLANHPNCRFHAGAIGAIPLPDASLDFAYCLGVLHVLPDAAAGLAASARKLKPGAPYLLYTLYALDNRPAWFRWLWRVADRGRRVVSGVPHRARRLLADLTAALVYLPLARGAALAEKLGADVANVPLSGYRHRDFYAMRTDALDRFGTPRETRFTAEELRAMMASAGLERVRVSEEPPYWCAIGYRAAVPGPT